MTDGVIQTLERTYTGAPSHRLPDELLAPPLLNAILTFAAGRSWVAVIMRRNGEMVVRASPEQFVDRPDSERMMFARTFAQRLNRELHHDGAWVVCWFGTEEWTAFWLDWDGDVQFTLDCSDVWARLRRVPVEKFLGDAEIAFAKWKLILVQTVGVTPAQTHKRAQGESPPPAPN